jgi:hypothetical protein
MPHVGTTELLVMLITAIFFWGIPIAAGIWIIVTLVRIRSRQHDIQIKLEEIERAISKQP